LPAETPQEEKGNNMIKRLLLGAVLTLTALFGVTAPAFAASPHYVRGPSATVEGNALTVSFKAAGMGNTAESADFNLAGTADVTSQCFTKSGNPINGVPKFEQVTVNATETFPVRNGQVTGVFTVEPLSTLVCSSKSHEVRILDVSFDLTLTGPGLPPVNLTG
jgi:hypothetical protein